MNCVRPIEPRGETTKKYMFRFSADRNVRRGRMNIDGELNVFHIQTNAALKLVDVQPFFFLWSKKFNFEHHYRSTLIENLQELSRHTVEMTNGFLFLEMKFDKPASVFFVRTQWSRQLDLHLNEVNIAAQHFEAYPKI